MSIVNICEWLDNRSTRISSRINTLMEQCNKMEEEGKTDFVDILETEIETLFSTMNKLDDRLLQLQRIA